MLRPPVPPMLAKAVDTLPTSDACAGGCRWEPKFDGWRCLAFRQTDGVHLQSRAGRALEGWFPDITAAVTDSVPANVVLDGELVIWDQQRTDFARLGQRITAGARLRHLVHAYPAHYVAFDLLQDPTGRALLNLPLAHRRALLERLLAAVGPQVTVCPQTGDIDQARAWLADWPVAGIEGVVAKGATSRYRPGRRGWLKYRPTTTTWAIIGGITGTLAAPETLLLGRYDDTGRLRYTGHSHPINPGQRHELAGLLQEAPRTTAGVDHPWPQPLPAAWTGHLDRSDPLPYIQVRPDLVAQISVDTAFEHHRWRHRVHYQAVRIDLSVHDVPRLQ
jgi:ATP-dependent DNA ligase